MLEALTAAGCRGMFATHLHALRQLDLRLGGTRWMQMETIEEVDPETGGRCCGCRVRSILALTDTLWPCKA